MKNDHNTRYTNPNIKTDYVLEEQAMMIYTKIIFLDVQSEIVAIGQCINAKIEEVEDFVKFSVKDFDQPCSTFFEVMFRKDDMTIYCSCRRYEQFGLLCRQIFYVLKLSDVREFPKKYIMRRWTREAVPKRAHIKNSNSVVDDDNVQSMMRDILFATEYILNRLSNNMSELSMYKDYVQGYMKKADELQVVAPPASKRDKISEMLGHKQNNKHSVRVPVV